MKTEITITRTSFQLYAAAAALGFALVGCGGGGGGGSGSTTSSPTVEVIVNPGTSPTANAGSAATYNGGEIAMLDGTGSTDADGDPLRYTWTQTGGTNTVQLSDRHAARPVFEVPNANDTLTFSLVANDGYSNSAPATVTITTQTYAGPSLSALTNSPFRGNFSWPSGSARAGISGNFAFVPADANGIAAVDITNPAMLVQAGTYTGSGVTTVELAVVGSYVYYADYDAFGAVHIYAVNAATPSSMVLCCQVMSHNVTAFSHLASTSNALYVADDSFYALSIPTPTNPLTSVAGATATLPAAAQDLAISGNYAYVADGASGLQIVDITNATAATPSASIVGSYATAAAQAVAASGSYAYVAQGTSGLAVVNVGTPASPTLAATIPAPGGVAVTHVDVSGNYVFFSTDFDVWVYDVTTPASPVLAGEYQAGNLITGVKVSGSYAYITDTMGLRTIPIAKPSLPRGASLYTVAGPVREMRVYGDLGFVRTDSRVDILDLRNSTAPTVLSSYNNTAAGSIMGMSLVDSFAYLTQGGSLQLLRFRNPSVPDIAKSITACSGAQNIAANDAYAYVYCNAYPNASVGIFDDSNPYTPVAKGSLVSPYNTANWLRDMAINGNQLYLTELNTSGTFRVANVSNPAAPSLVGSLSPTDLYGIAFRGNYVYSIGNNTGLKVVDVSNPASPTFAGSGYAQAGYTVSVAATRAYVNSDFVGGGVKIIDTANPLVPTLAGELTPSGGADIPVVDGNYLYTFYSGPGGVELHATEREPILAARYVTGTVSSTLTYNVSWLDAAGGNDQQVTCRVTAGTCTVGTINQANNTAPVNWTLPATAGDQEIEIAVGNGHYFNTTNDRVQVQ